MPGADAKPLTADQLKWASSFTGLDAANTERVKKMDSDFHTAVSAGDWKTAATIVNGYAAGDLGKHLQAAGPQNWSFLHQGALDAGLGETSAVAQATKAASGPPSGQAGAGAAAPPPQAQAIPVPSVSTGDKDALVASMRMVDSIKPGDGGKFSIDAKGGTQQITQQQADELRAKATAAVKDALGWVSNRADLAMGRYAAQQKVNVDSPVSAFTADLMAKAKAKLTGTHYEDPGPKLYPLSAAATNSISAAHAAAGGGKFATAAAALGDAEAAAAKVSGMVAAYCSGIIGGAETNVTVLEYTKTACFAIDGVIATVITGGGAAGLAGAIGAEGAGASAATAGLVANAAPIVASAASYGLQAAEGDPVDWKKATADILIQVVLAKFGGKLTEGLASQVGQAGGAVLQNDAVRKIIAAEVMQAGSATLQTVAATVTTDLEGKHVTWGQFLAAMQKAVLDPKGIIAAAALGAVSAKFPAPAATQGGPNPGATGEPAANTGGEAGAGVPETPNPAPQNEAATGETGKTALEAGAEAGTGAPDNPSSGGAGGEPGGGAKPRPLVNKGKNAEHTYMTEERGDRLAKEANAGAKTNAPERNPSLLSEEFASPTKADAIKAAVDAQIAQGNFQSDAGGAKSVVVDFAPEVTGWADGKATTKLIVRMRKNGTWHCFPAP